MEHLSKEIAISGELRDATKSPEFELFSILSLKEISSDKLFNNNN